MSRLSTPIRSFTLITAIAAATGTALASFSQSTTTAPGGFVQSGCYSLTCGCGIVPGSDMAAALGTPEDYHEQSFTGVSTAQAAASFGGSSIVNSTSGRVGMGFTHMAAANTSPDASHFAFASSNGGWKETFTVNHPTLTGSGFLVFRIRGRGSMLCTNLTGSAALTTTGYADNQELLMNSLFDRGGSDPIGTDRQRAQWGLASFGTTVSRSVSNDAVTMSAPFTFGQPFTLGIYAFTHAGQRSSGGAGGSSHGEIDFTVEWAGIVGVYVGGSPVPDATIVAGTTVNWGQVVPACPGDASGNNLVGLDDVAAVIQCWSQPASCNPAADLDGNGTIGIGDVAAVIAHWGSTCG